MVVDNTGNVFCLNTNGTIYEHAPGTLQTWNPIAVHMSAMMVDSPGNLFALNSAENAVYEHVPGSAGTWNKVIWLQNSTLYYLAQPGGNPVVIDTGVSSILQLVCEDGVIGILYLKNGKNITWLV
jgi:hypothetical protein